MSCGALNVLYGAAATASSAARRIRRAENAVRRDGWRLVDGGEEECRGCEPKLRRRRVSRARCRRCAAPWSPGNRCAAHARPTPPPPPPQSRPPRLAGRPLARMSRQQGLLRLQLRPRLSERRQCRRCAARNPRYRGPPSTWSAGGRRRLARRR